MTDTRFTETDNITGDIGADFDKSRRSYRKIMRDLLVQIIEKQDFPVAARLFSMACFTFELDSFVHTHGSALWGEKFNLEVHRVAGNGYEALWCQDFPDTGAIDPVHLERPVAMILSLFQGTKDRCRPEFFRMLGSSIALLQSDEPPEDASGPEPYISCAPPPHASRRESFAHSPEAPSNPLSRGGGLAGLSDENRRALTMGFCRRRKRLHERLFTELETETRHFCERILGYRDFERFENLFEFVQRMVIDTALFRFFLISSPAMEKIASSKTEATGADSRMVAEDIADTIVREEKAVLDLQKVLIEQQMRSLAETTLLIRI